MLMKVVDAPLRPWAPPGTGSCSDCAVRSHALFGVLGSASLEHAGDGVECVALAPGETIYGQGVTGRSLFTVRRGIVRFERVTEAGDSRIVRLAGRGGLIGQEALLHRRYADEAVACTQVQLCRIPRTVIERLGEQDPAIYRELMRRWQCSLEAAQEWTTELISGSSRRRVLKLLSELSELAGPGEPIWLPPRPEMGIMLGMAFETASRIISQLRREGVLETFFPVSARVNRSLLMQALRKENARA